MNMIWPILYGPYNMGDKSSHTVVDDTPLILQKKLTFQKYTENGLICGI